MLLENITEDELQFMEDFSDPVVLAECLFNDFDNLSTFDERDFGHVRNGQLSMISYEYIMEDEVKGLSKKDNFKILEGAGTIYNFGARKYGKSLITLIIDIFESIVHLDGWNTIFSSYDAVHIRSVLERVIPVSESHPFLKIFDVKVKRSPTYLLRYKNGFIINSVNMNVASKNPGAQFFGHHTKKLWIEEASKETAKVKEKRVDAISELGCIERISGMTDFTKYSPAGEVFYPLAKKPWVCNLPQYINPMWDNADKQKAAEKYGGEGSVGFRVFVKGEVVEEGISVFDMERVRNNYIENKTIKSFEVSKETFPMFEHRVIVERPANTERMFIFADIGESAPTEIGIVSEVNKKYKYLYNITLYNLDDKQQYKFFKWLILQLKAELTGLDCTDGTGRSIFRSLAEDFPTENLVWVSFNEKIPVDFDKDDKDNVIFKNGKPVYKEEYVSSWSVKHLKDLLYADKMEIPMDFKFDNQFNSVVVMQSSTRIVYKCISEADHLFQAFQVFAIMEWYNVFNNIRPIITKKFSKTGV